MIFFECDDEEVNEISGENAITMLKELAEAGYCSILEYIFSDNRVVVDGEKRLECYCSVKSWNINKTAYAYTKKE